MGPRSKICKTHFHLSALCDIIQFNILSVASITIVVPVRNELKNLHELAWRIDNLLRLEKNYDFELLFIDNASTDGSSEFIKNMAMKREDTTFIRFTRDFGIEASFDAGAKYSQ